MSSKKKMKDAFAAAASHGAKESISPGKALEQDVARVMAFIDDLGHPNNMKPEQYIEFLELCAADIALKLEGARDDARG